MSKTFVFYPGHHGPETRVQMRTGNRRMRFRAGEVRAMPAADAEDVINLCGYHRALTAAEAAARVAPSMTAEDLVTAGGLTTAEYRPQADADAETVIVLDQVTARRLRRLQAENADAPAAAAEPESSEPKPRPRRRPRQQKEDS